MLEKWRRLPTNHQSAGRQLALSESLLAFPLDRPAFYWYKATEPAFILGAAQNPNILEFATCKKAGYAVYKRTSGGALVLASSNFLSLDVLLPPTSQLANPDVTKAYRWFGECWQQTLARFGVATSLVTPDEARYARQNLVTDLVKLVCFGTLSSYEVATLDRRKLVGFAQIKRRTGSLLQAGLHWHWPAYEFSHFLDLTDHEKVVLSQQLTQQAVGLVELVIPPPIPEQICQVFEENLQAHWSVEWEDDQWSDQELAIAEQWAETKFARLT